MRDLAERMFFGVGGGLLIGVCAAGLAVVGVPYETDMQLFLLICGGQLVATILVAGAVCLWRGARGQSVTGTLVMAGWIGGAAVLSALLGLAGLSVEKGRDVKFVLMLGLVGAGVIVALTWFVRQVFKEMKG